MPQTLRDIRDKKSIKTFVDRASEVSFFTHFLEPESNAAILFVTGGGGYGKTSLLSQFRIMAQAKQIPVAFADLAVARTPFAILREWRSSLPSQGFKMFDDALSSYEDILRRINTRTSSEIDDSSLNLQKALNQIDAENSATELFQTADYRLTRSFIDCVNRGVGKKFPVLMLDSFELADSDLSRWLTEGLLSQLNHRTRLVIASRSIPGEIWSPWKELYVQLNLEPFSFEVVKHYLNLRGLDDPEFIKTAFDVTHGVPFALSLISDLGLDKIDSKTLRLLRNQIAHGAVDRLIRIVSPLSVRIRQVLYAAAVLGEFNADTLSQVCGEDVKEEFEFLREMSFVRSTSNGFEIHDVVRDYMLQALETDSPAELHELNARAQYVHLSVSEKKVVEQIGVNRSSSAASLSISLRILQSDTDKILQDLEQKELITRLSLTDDDEPLYSLSNNGVLIIQSIRETRP